MKNAGNRGKFDVKKSGRSESEEVAPFRPRARAVSAMIVDYSRFVVAQWREEEKDGTPRRGVDGRTVRTKLDCFFRKVEPGGVGYYRFFFRL